MVMVMVIKRSLAFVVLALTCFLCFSVSTDGVGQKGNQVGPLGFDGASNVLTKPHIQNHEPNEATVGYEQWRRLLHYRVSNQVKEVQNTWCIAKPSTSAANLDDIIQFCCTQPRVNCSVIQYGGICYNPASGKVSDASVVMNLYYKVSGKYFYDCYFNGSGLIVTQDPSVDKCIYPA